MQNALVRRHMYRRVGRRIFRPFNRGNALSASRANDPDGHHHQSCSSGISLAINTNAVTMSFLTTDYNTSTGAATKTVASANTLSVDSNKNWTVNVKANTAAFAFTPSAGDTDPSKPAGDFSYKLSTAGTYTPITTSNVVVKTGNKGGTSTAGNTFSMDYQLASNLNTDPPGTYTLAIVYTLTAP